MLLINNIIRIDVILDAIRIIFKKVRLCGCNDKNGLNKIKIFKMYEYCYVNNVIFIYEKQICYLKNTSNDYNYLYHYPISYKSSKLPENQKLNKQNYNEYNVNTYYNDKFVLYNKY